MSDIDSTTSNSEVKVNQSDWSSEVFNIIKCINSFERAIVRFGKKYEESSSCAPIDFTREARRIFRYGVSIANKIDDYVRSGRLKIAQRIWYDKTCESVRQLNMVEGVGPIRAAELVEAGVESVDDLYLHTHLMTRQQIIGLQHFEDLNKMIPWKEVQEIGDIIKSAVLGRYNGYKVELCGEFRRGIEQCREVDCLIMTNDIEKKDCIQDIVKRLIECSLIIDTIGISATKFSGVCRSRSENPVRRLSVRMSNSDQYPFLLLHHTGPKRFLNRLAKKGLECGLSLTEYSLHQLNNYGGIGESVPVSSEKEIFQVLGLAYVPPEERK